MWVSSESIQRDAEIWDNNFIMINFIIHKYLQLLEKQALCDSEVGLSEKLSFLILSFKWNQEKWQNY